jgi:hypothetical protein
MKPGGWLHSSVMEIGIVKKGYHAIEGWGK